jgi:hypothetical protein
LAFSTYNVTAVLFLIVGCWDLGLVDWRRGWCLLAFGVAHSLAGRLPLRPFVPGMIAMPAVRVPATAATTSTPSVHEVHQRAKDKKNDDGV